MIRLFRNIQWCLFKMGFSRMIGKDGAKSHKNMANKFKLLAMTS